MNALAVINHEWVLLMDQRALNCQDLWAYFSFFTTFTRERTAAGCPTEPTTIITVAALFVPVPASQATVTAEPLVVSGTVMPLSTLAPYCLKLGTPNVGDILLALCAHETKPLRMAFQPDRNNASPLLGQLVVNIHACLSLYGGGLGNGAAVRVSACYTKSDAPRVYSVSSYMMGAFNGWNNVWEWVPARRQFRNPQSGRCLTVKDGVMEEGTPLELYDCRTDGEYPAQQLLLLS